MREQFSRMVATMNSAVHVFMTGAYFFTLIYAFYYLRIPALDSAFKKFDPGQLRYLTVWNVIIQALFFLICILNDWFGTAAVNPKKAPFMRKLKDYFHATLGFPVAMFVGVTFWALMFVDRELVLPKALDPYFPWWLNHLMHTMIMVSTVLEMIVAPRQYPKRSRGLLGLVLFMLSYLLWMHLIYFMSGVWVYPVMDVLTVPLRIVFFAALLALSTILYFAGEALDNFVWGNEQSKHRRSHSKSK